MWTMFCPETIYCLLVSQHDNLRHANIYKTCNWSNVAPTRSIPANKHPCKWKRCTHGASKWRSAHRSATYCTAIGVTRGGGAYKYVYIYIYIHRYIDIDVCVTIYIYIYDRGVVGVQRGLHFSKMPQAKHGSDLPYTLFAKRESPRNNTWTLYYTMT